MLDKAVPPRTLKLNAADNVAVAVDPIDVGVSAAGVTALKRIPRGHKIALTRIAKDEFLYDWMIANLKKRRK